MLHLVVLNGQICFTYQNLGVEFCGWLHLRLRVRSQPHALHKGNTVTVNSILLLYRQWVMKILTLVSLWGPKFSPWLWLLFSFSPFYCSSNIQISFGECSERPTYNWNYFSLTKAVQKTNQINNRLATTYFLFSHRSPLSTLISTKNLFIGCTLKCSSTYFLPHLLFWFTRYLSHI